ncbi:unnamed protein product [Durusdinium trenchii]|uniref:Uncharacterized protein n=1 Tax=Durusdinium trenchii TaxID=1381693 RepID=A0ABP0RY33_9DINO
MGQGWAPCCEVTESANRVSIRPEERRPETANSQRPFATSVKSEHTREAGEQLDWNLRPCEGNSWSGPALGDSDSVDAPNAVQKVNSSHSEKSSVPSQRPSISTIKAFVRELVRGHVSRLISEAGENEPCILILDKAIRKLSVCQVEGAKRGRSKHEIQLALVQDILTQDTSSYNGFGAAMRNTRSEKQYKAGIQWPSGPSNGLLFLAFASSRERDVFVSAFAMLCHQVQTLDGFATDIEPGEVGDIQLLRTQVPSGQFGAELPAREPGASLFHTTPGKFVQFGDASVSDVTDLGQLNADWWTQMTGGLLPGETKGTTFHKVGQASRPANPIRETLQQTKDALKSRPWKPPSLVMEHSSSTDLARG